ncbi:transcription antitermination factor NusB [Corynebacterium sp. HMSC04H06]|uniref:transcription antitermination factor NusB n=1 Tax=Corynebacterium sp. HMSC04H06 TaxID=1581050 RepID=UPI0008A2F98E|nr:transcription antitermination factor NusB [Corynebacterium sp. HMSC04H06]OFS22585.1 transcription antitermination factor NusB [Corynebacterium sp. HMSC04H06]
MSRNRRHGARYRARRRAADILYEAENRDIDPVAIVQERKGLALEGEHGVAPIADYTAEIVQGVAEELDDIDDAIARYLADDWSLDRLPPVERAILRVSTWELLYNPEVPLATAVTEGVELASEYSHIKAAPYINAVLDDVAQSRRAGNPMTPEEDLVSEETADGAETAADSPEGEKDTPAE